MPFEFNLKSVPNLKLFPLVISMSSAKKVKGSIKNPDNNEIVEEIIERKGTLKGKIIDDHLYILEK